MFYVSTKIFFIKYLIFSGLTMITPHRIFLLFLRPAKHFYYYKRLRASFYVCSIIVRRTIKLKLNHLIFPKYNSNYKASLICIIRRMLYVSDYFLFFKFEISDFGVFYIDYGIETRFVFLCRYFS